jgi:hypothetical protein
MHNFNIASSALPISLSNKRLVAQASPRPTSSFFGHTIVRPSAWQGGVGGVAVMASESRAVNFHPRELALFGSK